MKMDDQTTNMWMSKGKNNNINIILIDSLESLHQREFGLQSSQQWVVLASYCHEKLTNIKGGMKWREMEWNGSARALESDFFQQWLFCFHLLLVSSPSEMEWNGSVRALELSCTLSVKLVLSTHVQLD